MDRNELAKQARELLSRATPSRDAVAKAAGISAGSLRIALAPRTAGRSAVLPAYLIAMADELDKQAEDLREITRDLRRLAQAADEAPPGARGLNRTN